MKKNLLGQKVSNRQLFIIFIILFIINLVFIGYHTGQYSDDTPTGPVGPNLIATAIVGMALMILILCLIVASVVALFINRDVPYKTRFIRTFLLIAALANGFMVIRVIFDIFMES